MNDKDRIFLDTLRRALLTTVRETEKLDMTTVPAWAAGLVEAHRRSNLQIVSMIEREYGIGSKKKRERGKKR